MTPRYMLFYAVLLYLTKLNLLFTLSGSFHIRNLEIHGDHILYVNNMSLLNFAKLLSLFLSKCIVAGKFSLVTKLNSTTCHHYH